MVIRQQSNKLIFIDIEGDQHKLQLFCNAGMYKGDFEALKANVKRGDIIGVEGQPGRTNTGELSVRPTEITQLSYCMHMMPAREGDKNVLTKDTRYRQRYLDLIMNNPVKKIFRRRNEIIAYLRNFLAEMDFT